MVQNFKQAWQIIKQNKFYSSIYIIGTTLSISLVMVIAMSWIIMTANTYPEVNRDRMLNLSYITAKHKDHNSMSSSSISERAVEILTKDLQGIEAVAEAAYGGKEKFIIENSLSKAELFNIHIRPVNDEFWNVFEFDFIHGSPFSKEDIENKEFKTIVSKELAIKIFGKSDVVGERMKSYSSSEVYTITGVVRTPPLSTTIAYSELWIPISINENRDSDYYELLGGFQAYILLEKGADSEEVSKAVQERLTTFNNTLDDFEYDLMGQPDTYVVNLLRKWSNVPPDIDQYILLISLIIFGFILIPSINLAGMITSNMYKRAEEIGIRKAFGATERSILVQIINENLLLSLIGGFVGLVTSYFIIFGAYNLIIPVIVPAADYGYLGNPSGNPINFSVLFNPLIFIATLIASAILNLLSAIIPAYYAMKRNIVESLNSVKK